MKLFKFICAILIVSSIYLVLLWNQELILPEQLIETIHENDLEPTALFYTESAISSQVYFEIRVVRSKQKEVEDSHREKLVKSDDN